MTLWLGLRAMQSASRGLRRQEAGEERREEENAEINRGRQRSGQIRRSHRPIDRREIEGKRRKREEDEAQQQSRRDAEAAVHLMSAGCGIGSATVVYPSQHRYTTPSTARLRAQLQPLA